MSTPRLLRASFSLYFFFQYFTYKTFCITLGYTCIQFFSTIYSFSGALGAGIFFGGLMTSEVRITKEVLNKHHITTGDNLGKLIAMREEYD